MDCTRRELLRSLGMLLAGSGFIGVGCTTRPSGQRAAGTGKIPLLHTTDLYHPPQDPDDQIDLATVLALREYDLQGVVLDITEQFLRAAPDGWDIPRDPGYVPVSQMAYMTGRPIPAALGPIRPLVHPADRCEEVPAEQQAGIQMIIDVLGASPEPVTISVTGSPRAVTAAYNREPALLRAKTRAVLLNAGSTGGPKTEWNLQLDPQAYIGLWRSELPIDWFPPGTDSGAFDAAHERGTYWKATHAELFRDMPPELRGYFAYALTGDARDDIVGALTEQPDEAAWQSILSEERNLWSTTSLVMGAGQVLAKTQEGWRFLPQAKADGLELWPWRLDPIRAQVDDQATVSWEVVDNGTNRRIFGRGPGRQFGAAMAQALNALLGEMPR